MAVLDDGLFVRTYAGEVRPVSATFNRFVEAVAKTGAFEHVRYLVPVRNLRIWELEPAFDAVDESVLQVVPTASFSGISDYLLRGAYLTARNSRPIDQAIAESDLLWLRLPASNALLALAAARRHGVPHFGWVAGSVGDVARAQPRPLPTKWFAQAVGAGYDAVTRLAGRNGPLITLDSELFSSVVTDDEVEQTRAAATTVRTDGPWRLTWAGRMAAEKALPELIEAVGVLIERGCDITLVLVGDGPARAQVESLLARLPAERVEDYGYVGNRDTYMDLLRGGDLFLHTSGAEGVPKVLVEAMAAGVPVVARDAGSVADLLGNGERGRIVASSDPQALANAISGLLDDGTERQHLRDRGLEWAADHTAARQAERLVAWLHDRFPELAW